MKIISLCFVLFGIIFPADCAKVLGVFPEETNSHFAIGNAIVKSLHSAGHEITVISPFSQKKKLKNLREISTADILVNASYTSDSFNVINKNPIFLFSFLYDLGSEVVNSHMLHPNVKRLLNSGEKFDVCLIEVFNFDALLGLADHFDCVLITYTTFGYVKWINYMTANEMPASYVPHPFLHYTDKMTFTQRLYNTIMSRVEDVLYSAVHIPNQRRLYKKYFPNARKSLDEMIKSSAVIFVNNHVSSSSSRPYLPNMIEIGGIHVDEPKPLPSDIKQFLDSATEGAILFSMGSFVQSSDWPIEKREALLRVFGKLKQKVLWKYENDTLPNKPDNVMISSWIPQRDIVAHPNIRLFITHGGLLGTTEALVEGVPVLGIPVFGDQMMNIAKAVSRGYALQVALHDVSERRMDEALKELLTNPKYRKNAKLIASRFVDRPMTPNQSVVYWTEFALRHKGASYLRAAGNDLSFIEFHLIDVYLTLAVVGFLFLYIDYLVLKFVLFKISKSNLATEKLKKLE